MYKIKSKVFENVNAGDVVYLRRNKTIIAARVIRYEFRSDGAMAPSEIVLHRADGNDENPFIQSGVRIYNTIEDAIHDQPIPVVCVTINSIYEDLGFTEHPYHLGMTKYAKIMYEWDGYNAVKKRVYSDAYLLKITECGVSAEYKHSDKLYETREECMKEHQTKVITF